MAAACETADGDVRGEASMMLLRTRLMDVSVWGRIPQNSHEKQPQERQKMKGLQELAAMGFRHVLSPQVLISPHSPPASSPCARLSDRVRSCHVTAFDDSLQVKCWRSHNFSSSLAGCDVDLAAFAPCACS